MAFKYFHISLFCFFALFFFEDAVSQCSTLISPAITNSANKSCGLPIVYNFGNNSSGSHSTIANYTWKVNNVVLRIDTGKHSYRHNFTLPGTYVVKLISRDTGSNPCVDSANVTITVTSIIPTIQGGNGGFSTNPTWQNCITLPTSPDTFSVNFRTSDTLHNYKIHWGDSANTTVSGAALLSSQSHTFLYKKLGLFTLMVTSTKNGCTDTTRYLVINERNPVASLQGPPSGLNYGCAPFTTRFINTSPYASSTTIYSWTMGDGRVYTFPASSVGDTLYHTYRRFLCNGVVLLTATNACGFSSATWSPIQMGARDSAILIPSNPTNCNLATPFVFNNSSQNRYCITPNPRRYRFYWGDGTNSGWLTTTASQSKTYTQRGTYTVLLIDSNSCGKDTADYILTIDSLPISLASANPLVGCIPLVTNFNAQSIGNVTTRSWNFGDPTSGANNTSTDTMPSHTYNTAGNFNAVLSLSNVCGTVRDTIAIRANRTVIASFAAINGGCYPYTVNYTNTSSPWFSSGTTYSWLLANGNTSTAQNPGSTIINSQGTYTVRLIATDSCGSDTFSRTFNVYGQPPVSAQIVGGNIGCQGAPLQLRYVTNNASNTIRWNHDDYKATSLFTGDTALSHIYVFDSLRTYNNTLIVSDINGCSDTLLFPIAVNPKPKAVFYFRDSLGCSPFNATARAFSISNGPGASSHFWRMDNSFVSTTDSLNYNVFGSNTKDTNKIIQYSITNSYGCSDTLTKPILIYPKPVSSFVLVDDSLCGPAAMQFQNHSIPNDTGSIAIMSFNWYFGDGGVSTSTNPSHTFNPGNTQDTLYIQALVAFSEHGCADTSYGTSYVYPMPFVDFTQNVTNACRPASPVFTNISDPKDTGSIAIMSFRWNLGNGNTSNSRNPTVSYNQISNTPITYTISLVGTSEHGCKDSNSHTFILNPTPITSFNSSSISGCSPLQRTFTNTTTNGNTYSWIINNQQVSTAQNLTQSFIGRNYADSIIRVKLASASVFGCVGDTAERIITVFAKPTAAFVPDEDTFCFNDPTQFLNHSLGAYTYSWNFGDGSSSVAINPLHQFAKSSNPFNDSVYTVRLIARAYNGCADTNSGYINVYPYPVANFTAVPQVNCSPSRVSFTNSSINSVSYYWDFGDGTVSTSANPVKIYDNRGFADTVFKVTLYAYSLDCVDTSTRFITVNPKPLAFFNADKIRPCSNEIQFYNASLRAVSVVYNFGDGNTSAQFNPIHNYYASPFRDTVYNTTLIVTSNLGCRDTISRPIPISQRLIVNFHDTTIVSCPPLNVQFRNKSLGAIAYLWDFGDQVGSASTNPSHVYTQAGTYRFKLRAFDATGCTDSILSTGTIIISDRPNAQFDFTPKVLRINEQTTVNFFDQSIFNLPVSYSWNFNNINTIQSVAPNPIYTYTDSGSFLARLILFNGGCYDTFEQVIRVDPPYPIPDFDANPINGCAPLISNFVNNSRYADKFLWQFGDGDTSTQVNPSHLYLYPGQYTVSLIAYGPGGERKITKTNIITIPEKPYAYFNLGPTNLYLPYAQLYAENGSSRAISYIWYVFHHATNTLEHTATTTNLNYNLTDTGLHTVMLVAIHSDGCTDTFIRAGGVYVLANGIIHIPNAFAPDGDGINDIFKPVMINYTNTNYRFAVYNRWGQKIFETNNPTQGWDGTYMGSPCATEVFAYEVKVNFVDGGEKTEKGIVHLLR